MSIYGRIYSLIPGVKIVGMHHLCNEPDELCDCVISKENFITFLKNKRFVSWQEAVKHPCKNNGAWCITIDDGLKDLYDIYLITKEKNIPIVAFISSDLVGKTGYISKEQLIEMSKDKLVTIGSHGKNHIKITECDKKRKKDEINNSKIELEKIINKTVELYAYPNGAFSKKDKSIVKNAGYRYAFGVLPRKNTFITKLFSQYEIPRQNLTNSTYMGWMG